ncbi:serine hydrolase domain-containing protein [Enterococcus sp. 2201sp1_2201st1_B8_2201SCRN_220225]|uniref:serine hydrolase domain-containing protein n=1 Tax=unclassified Enterococcus TaxID=2608891 RepID=UPI0034A4F875
MYPNTRNLITKKRQQGVYPGVNYGFLQGNQERFYGEGLASLLPQKEQMTLDKRFDVASLTKVVCTTTMLLKLWEQKVITWEESVKHFLPNFQDSRITLRHLLTHTANIQTWINNRDQLNEDQLRQAYYGLTAGNKLGQEVKYTDAGTILLGFMLEEIFQQDVVEIFKKEVLEPLGMKNSGFLPEKTEIPQIVPTEVVQGHLLQGVTHDPKARVLGRHAGNAGLFTDLGDLARFCRMFLHHGRNGGGKIFLQESTIEALLQDQTPLKNGGRSLGWDLRLGAKNQPALFHTGYTGTFLLIDVAAQEAFIFLSNRVHPVDHREAYLQERDQIIACYQKERGIIF